MTGLVAYVDESLASSGTPYFAVAGTVATSEQWRAFEAEWQPLVAGLKKPFHAKNRECTALAEPLAKLMVRHTIVSAYVVFPMDVYERALPKEVKARFGSEYQLGLQLVIGGFAEWSREAKAGRVSYFIESGHRGFQYASQYMNAVCQREDMKEVWQVQTWGSATKADLPCHAPDSLAHWGTKFDSTGRTNRFLQILASNRMLKFGEVTEDILRDTYVPEMLGILKWERAIRNNSKKQRWRARKAKSAKG